MARRRDGRGEWGGRDLVAVRYAAMLNEPTGLVLTLLDVLSGIDELKVCTAYRVGGEDDGAGSCPIARTSRG
jgi:adenylosuccinate synthase